ncbi:MAG: hypothetical protein K0R99_5024 [Microbacterium sp.]|jgi:lysophospholipase L1-like esterase|uniref:hypothetical protein n=1 Tax=Microbacterium sp. TaxID=51671 RepID=UPI0026073468|nr:hypothetical protein [Microbacterium sp.]MDF2563578.1 hypothetical protein [Microbacterium sp.]
MADGDLSIIGGSMFREFGGVPRPIAPGDALPFASLDETGKIPESQVPDRLTDAGIAATAETVAAPLADYVWAGDSLSAQGGGTGVAPGSFLATLTGDSVSIDAVGGETSAGIAARLNALPLLVTPVGGSLPASGAVTVTFTSPTGETVWPLLQAAGNPAIGKTWVGSIAGVAGTLALVQPSGTSVTHQVDDYYTFTRATAGNAIPLPRAVPFIIDYAGTHERKFHILWPGRNDIAATTPDIDQMVANLQAMVTKVTADRGDFLVLGVINGASEGTATTLHTNATAYNARVADLYGRRFLDIRRGLIDHGLAIAGIAPTSQDLTDIGADLVPDSLRTDAVHLEVAAREVVAQLVYERLQELGREPQQVGLPAESFTMTDTFTRADSADLGSGWVAGHDYQIVGNRLTRVGTSVTPALLLPDADFGSTDMEASFDVVSRGGSTSVGIAVRYLDANNFIGARINNLTNVLIYKMVAGVTTSLGGADDLWTADGAQFTVQVIGNTITVLRDGVQIIAVTTAVPEVSAATKVAIRTASAASKPVFDNFYAAGL